MWFNYFRNGLKLFVLLCAFLWILPWGFTAPFPQIWQVPIDNPNFVGREGILNDISTIFKESPLKIAVISGHQGFGKSQTAKHYAHQNYKNYDVVWWFRANQYLKPQFEKFALEIAPYLGLSLNSATLLTIGHERLVSLVKGEIRQKNLKCLIIFDDAQTYENIEPYVLFSHKKTIHSLITTKNKNLFQQAIQIKPFRRETSVKYITLFLPDEPQTSKEFLARHLGDCPAALALSINYIKGYPGMTIDRYLNRHKQIKGSLLPENDREKKLGSPIDDYETDLLAAIQINMAALRRNSQEAFKLLGLLSLFHWDEIPISFIESWVNKRNVRTDVKKLIDMINQYSFVEITAPKNSSQNTPNNKGAYISMQELIQQIVNSLVPLPDKKKLIDEAVQILKPPFSSRSDKVIDAILKDNNPLLHAIRISKEADVIGHHNRDLTIVRVKALDVLIGGVRDLRTSQQIVGHLRKDFENGITLPKHEKILYHINLSLFFAMKSADYERAIWHGQKALVLLETEKEMYEEKVCTIANLIQYHALSGLTDQCQQLVETGEKLLPLSQSQMDNTLYVYATTMFLLDRGKTKHVITLIRNLETLWKKQDFHPPIRYFAYNQFAEALIKEGEIEEAKNALSLSEKYVEGFYEKNARNNLIGKLYLLKAACQLNHPISFDSTKALIEKGLSVYETVYKGANKHRTQAFGYLLLGKLHHIHKHYKQAKAHYLKSEEIFDTILKNKKVDDVSDLYKQLALLGIDSTDETLTHIYLQKQIGTFGLDHPKTKEALIYLDERGLPLPF